MEARTGPAKAMAGAGRGKPGKALAAMPDTRTVAIRSLVRDPCYQVRGRLDEATVSRYASVLAEGLTMPPIKVANVNGVLIVVDGHHRIAAQERRGLGAVAAEIFTANASEAQWMAAQANMAHGLPLRKAEIRTAFHALIRARRHIPGPGKLLSYRELTVLMGGLIRHTTLRTWMMADFPHIARQMSQEDPMIASREAARDDEAGFFNAATAAIDTAAANAPAVRDPSRRGNLIEATERLLKALRSGGEFIESEF